MNDELLIKFLLKETDSYENELVDKWLALDAANVKHFNQLKFLWDSSKHLASESTVDEHAAWERFKQKTIEHGPTKVIPLKRTNWLRIAAILCVLIGAGWLSYRFAIRPNLFPESLALQTQINTRIDTLPDGSVITLNKFSALKYPEKFVGNSRNISLEQGEAFFDVAKNKNKPFIIRVKDVTVKVVGTSFNIKITDKNTEVIVETGIVQVSKNGKTIELLPSEKVTVNNNNSSLIKENSTDHLYNYYRSKEFEANNTPLKRVIEVLNEAYGAHIILEREELGEMPLTTTFKNESLDDILDVISKTFNLKVEKKNKTIIIR